jgi:hypothetical protein
MQYNMLHCIQVSILSQLFVLSFLGFEFHQDSVESGVSGDQAILAIHAEGSIEAEKLAVVCEHDSLRCKQLAKRLAGIADVKLERRN